MNILFWILASILSYLNAKNMFKSSIFSVAIAPAIFLFITSIVITLNIQFSKFWILIFLLFIFIIGYNYIKNKSEYFFKIDLYGYIYIIFITILAVGVPNIEHYDYYHSHYLAKDLAYSGYPRSNWMEMVDNDKWFLIQQASAIIADALQYMTMGNITGVFPKIYLASLISITYILIFNTNGKYPAILYSIIIFPIYYEVLIYFRPHLIIGLYIGVLIILLNDLNKYVKNGVTTIYFLVVVLISILMAKRDGLIIAPLIFLVILLSLKNLKWNIKIVFIFIIIPIFFYFSSLPKIGGMSPLEILAIKFNTQHDIKFNFNKNIIYSFIFIFISILFSIISFLKKKYSISAVLIIINAVVIISGYILFLEDRWSEGTFVRKVQYFLIPPLTVYMAILLPEYKNIRNKKLNKFIFISFFLITSMIYFAAFKFWFVHSLTPNYEWGRLTNTAEKFWKNINIEGISRYCFLDLYENAFLLSPDKKLMTSKFPILSGLHNKEIYFLKKYGDNDNCDIVIFPHDSTYAEISDFNSRLYTLRKLHGSYYMHIKNNLLPLISDTLLEVRGNGSPVSGVIREIAWQGTKLVIFPLGTSINIVPWGEGSQFLIVQAPNDDSRGFTIFIANENKLYYSSLKFSVHPNGDNYPDFILLKIGETIKKYQLKNLMNGQEVLIPIETSKPFELLFEFPELKSDFWKARYIDLMNPVFIVE